MRVNGQKISEVEGVLKGIKKAILMRESSLIIKLMVEEFTNGLKEKYMMENGKMERKRGTEYGEEFMEIVISENGKIVKLRAMECTFGKMEINMKENGLIA